MKIKLISIISISAISIYANANLLRSAGLYYTPEKQVEANTTMSYGSRERTQNSTTLKTSYGTAGVRFEHGISENLSWGSSVSYGMGNNERKTTQSLIKDNYQGLLDPELSLKSHFSTENFRFHLNGIFALKSEAMVLNYEHTPINFSSGGSTLALLTGAEGAFGPTLLGIDLRGDIWKDKQEIVEKNAAQIETLYFRQGGKIITSSLFAELNNMKTIKPGIRFRASQINESQTDIKDNQRLTSTSISKYSLPRETQLSASIYGRVRLPTHFILNFEVFAMDSSFDSTILAKHNSSYGMASFVGYKF